MQLQHVCLVRAYIEKNNYLIDLMTQKTQNSCFVFQNMFLSKLHPTL